jgi:hypothetical protein
MPKIELLRTVVDLSFLALTVVLITTLLADRYDSSTDAAISLEIQNLRKDVLDASMKNLIFLETKINRVAELSDAYQVNTTRRIDVLERRMDSLETRAKSNSRVINTNTNTTTVNK